MLLNGINGELKEAAKRRDLMKLMEGEAEGEGGRPTLTNSSRVPWIGASVNANGDLTVDLRSDLAAESRAKIVYFTMDLAGNGSLVQFMPGLDGVNPLNGFVHGADSNFYDAVPAGGGASNFGTASLSINSAPCDDTLKLSCATGTLNVGFTVKSTAAATWATYLITPAGATRL